MIIHKFVLNDDGTARVLCHWEEACTNDAYRLRKHFFMGCVPICVSCDSKARSLDDDGGTT